MYKKYYILILFISVSFMLPFCLKGQNLAQQNVQAKGYVVDPHTIKIRWSPANPKAWSDGRRYGYIIEKYTVIIDGQWQESPTKEQIDKIFKPAPLKDWEQKVQQSDYAAVVAQAFYGDSFDLTSAGSGIADIINQANELEQRFSTSVFMAEYDYQTAELAGWAWTDNTAKPNEKYLYRIYLNKPGKTEEDMSPVFIGFDDKKDLPRPIGLNALFGDKSVLLTWNYRLLSDVYHSYHVERKIASENEFNRITELPLTALNNEMSEVFFTDSLPNNETTYQYRLVGITSFDQESPVSDTISGHGAKSVTCVPQILSGYFENAQLARLAWEFNCEETGLVDKFQLKKSLNPDTDYQLLLDNISLNQREVKIELKDEVNYLKLYVINKAGREYESFPFLLKQTDSIPPAIPTGLKVEIDSLGVAHLAWNANTEPDFKGYRILRSFTAEGEKSSLTPQFITDNKYTDTLSLVLSNPKVYYALTAIDMRYNESEPCMDVPAEKPNLTTPSDPIFTKYEVNGNKVFLSWLVDTGRSDIEYSLVRTSFELPQYNRTVFKGDYTISSFTDELVESGRYQYMVIAKDTLGRKTLSPYRVTVDVIVKEEKQSISGFNVYTDRVNNYIELGWSKHLRAVTYRLYKATDMKQATLWKELDASQNRVVDEHVQADTKYTYTIVFIDETGKSSQAKTITVNY